MPYLYHSFVSTKTDSADSGLVRPTNWNDRLEYSNAGATGPSGTDATVREVLTAARSYFVATAGGGGSDSNTGLTSGTPFLTLQHAYDVISATLDFGGQDITINVGAGTYTTGVTMGTTWVGGGSLTWQGAGATSIISTTGADCFRVLVPLPGNLTIDGFKLTTATSRHCINLAGRGTIFFANTSLEFAACAGQHMIAQVPGASIVANGNYSITGGAVNHAYATAQGAYIAMDGVTVTGTGAQAFTQFVRAVGGYVSALGTTFSGTGSFTGVRYDLAGGGAIETAGGGANFFPGNVAGTGTAVTGTGFYG